MSKKLLIEVYYDESTLDCYTVFIQEDDDLYVCAMGKDGKGFNQFLDSCNMSERHSFKYKKGSHLGKKIGWNSLSDETKKAIFARAL